METPTIWSQESELKYGHYTNKEDKVRERGEKVKTKCSSEGRNLQWNGEGVREECEEGWREVYLESQIFGMQTAEGEKGRETWESRGREIKGRS